MIANEFKLRVVSMLNGLIDVYFSEDNIIDRMTNSTLKVLLATNIDKIDDFIGMFSNGEGNIDEVSIVNAYADNIKEDGIRFNLKQYVKNDFIRNIIPDKSLIITKDDVLGLLKDA